VITTMIMSGVRSLYRSHRIPVAITAGEKTTKRRKWFRLRAKSARNKGHLMRRLTTASLAALKDQLSDRDKAILADLEHTRLLTGAQLQRLRFAHIDQDSQARDRRRVLQRLADLGLVSALERRIGGTRAGSAGHIYTLTAAGRRLQALQRRQPPPKRLQRFRTPGPPFLTHALAISEIYVSLHEGSRNQDFHVSTFDTEPACWHRVENGHYLHPDAYLILATPSHQDCWWLEIDQATESLPRIKRKCCAYLDFLIHAGTGPDGVPPRIMFTAPDARRTIAIQQVITTLTTTETNPLICVTTHTDASKFLITELAEP
jgi:Replication-relaxation